MNVSLLKLFVGFFRFSCVFLLFVFKVCALQLSFVVNVSLFAFFKLDQFVIKVLKLGEVRNDAAFIILLTLFFKAVVANFEHL